MDISKPIFYRLFPLNSATLETGRTLRGITVENVDYSVIEVVGYTEKRAASDGIHASDVYYGRRIIQMNGLIYGSTQAELHDFLHTLTAIFSPTSAYQQAPGDRGFMPLEFKRPTDDVESFPTGIVDLYMNVRPMEPLSFQISRDRLTNGNKGRPTALPWQVRLVAKDPRLYVSPDQDIDLAGAPTTVNNPVFAENRGDYETPLNITLVIGASAPAAGATFRVKGADWDIRIAVEAKANVVYRWMGDDRVLMTQDVSGGVTTNPLVLRMDLVTWGTKNHKPMVPALIEAPSKPYSTRLDYYRTLLTLAAGSRLWWSEAFA